jgi:hypothetical protein
MKSSQDIKLKHSVVISSYEFRLKDYLRYKLGKIILSDYNSKVKIQLRKENEITKI